MPVPDPAHKATDEKIKKLEERIKAQYKSAMDAAEVKWKAYMQSFQAEDALQAERLANGEITKEEYQNWRTRHLAMGKHWEDMKNTLAQDYHNANVIATKMARGELGDVFATNANYATYLIEHDGKIDTGFTLYNHETAEELLKHEWTINPETGKNSFLPPPKPGGKRARELERLRGTNPDVLWNTQNIQSAMMQGILTGESLPDIAKRLAGVAKMNETQAKRTARTMFTNMENFGRMKAANRAACLGVEIMDEWSAILDGVTRHSHRHLHGYRKPHNMDEPFPNGCRWPGDPSGPPQEVYNCRCTLLNWVVGFEGDTVKKSPGMGEMSFDEWLDAHRG